MSTTDRVLQILSRREARAGEVAIELGITPNVAWIAFGVLRRRGAIELVSAHGRHRVYRATGSNAAPAGPMTGHVGQRFYGSEPCALAEVWK